MLFNKASCDTQTPFGNPVVPEEHNIAATCDAPFLKGCSLQKKMYIRIFL